MVPCIAVVVLLNVGCCNLDMISSMAIVDWSVSSSCSPSEIPMDEVGSMLDVVKGDGMDEVGSLLDVVSNDGGNDEAVDRRCESEFLKDNDGSGVVFGCNAPVGLLRHFFDTISLFGPLYGVFVVLSWECCNNCCIFCNKISVSSAIPGSVIGSRGVTSSDVIMVGKTVIVFCSAKNSGMVVSSLLSSFFFLRYMMWISGQIFRFGLEDRSSRYTVSLSF